MSFELVTGNHAAGYALATAGEANREARGAACGIYPITPQTEIVEYVAAHPFSKGRVIPAESEHSAMAISIGAAVGGARSFTASSANGIAYMTENIMVAGYYRLPIVMVAVNRTLGPPWNIWADQGDTLALRILDVFVRHSAAGVVVNQHPGHPLEFGDERHDARLGLGHLDVGAQPFEVPGGQRQVMLSSQVQDRL